MDFENDDKLKAFLKKESKRLGISIRNTYNTYFSKLLLERVCRIGYGKLYVKGSFSELSHLEEMIRPITDIDLVSTDYHNDPLITLYRAMYETNEDLYYELTDIPKRTKTGIYKLHITANFGKIKHPISIDFQEFSKTIYEKDYKRVTPVFNGDNYFYISTPSYEEHLAEKLCIVVESNKENILNTRVKDFYDVYKLNGGKYDREKLSYFFYHMLIDRNKVNIDNISVNHLDINYIERHREMWQSISDKYEFIDKTVKFDDAVFLTKEILEQEIKNLDKSKKLKVNLL